MQFAWFAVLVLGLPAVVYAFLRPKDAVLADDFAPFPLILRAAGGLRQYPALLLLGAVANLPLLLLLLVGGRPLDGSDVLACMIVWSLFLPAVAQGAVTFGVLRPLRRARPSSRAIVRNGLAGLARALPAAVLATACAAVPFAIGIALMRSTAGARLPGGLILGWSIAVMTLVIVSGLYLAPAVACDRNPGTLHALRGSLSITYGYRLRIVGILLFFTLASSTLIGGVSSLGASRAQGGPSVVSLLLVAYPVSTLVGTWHAVTAVIVYHRLRKLKYGGEVDGLLEVFE